MSIDRPNPDEAQVRAPEMAAVKRAAERLKESEVRQRSNTARAQPKKESLYVRGEERGHVSSEELLGRLADRLERQQSEKRQAPRTPERPSAKPREKVVKNKLQELDRRSDARRGDEKKERPLDATFHAPAERTAADRPAVPEPPLSAAERAERSRVVRPEGGVGFHHGSSLPAGDHLNQWLAEVTPEQRKAVAEGRTEIVITGFASRSGKRLDNQELSEARARNVALQLELKGFDRSRIHYSGVGEDLAAAAGRPDHKDNAADRIALIEIVPMVETRRPEKVKVTPEERTQVVDRLLKGIPEPPARSIAEEARSGLFNPFSVFGIAKFGVNGVKQWLESGRVARENFKVANDFIPAFVGRIEWLTSGSTRTEPLQEKSLAAALGRRCADTHFTALTHRDRLKLVAAMNDDAGRTAALEQMRTALHRRMVR